MFAYTTAVNILSDIASKSRQIYAICLPADLDD